MSKKILKEDDSYPKDLGKCTSCGEIVTEEDTDGFLSYTCPNCGLEDKICDLYEICDENDYYGQNDVSNGQPSIGDDASANYRHYDQYEPGDLTNDEYFRLLSEFNHRHPYLSETQVAQFLSDRWGFSEGNEEQLEESWNSVGSKFTIPIPTDDDEDDEYESSRNVPMVDDDDQLDESYKYINKNKMNESKSYMSNIADSISEQDYCSSDEADEMVEAIWTLLVKDLKLNEIEADDLMSKYADFIVERVCEGDAVDAIATKLRGFAAQQLGESRKKKLKEDTSTADIAVYSGFFNKEDSEKIGSAYEKRKKEVNQKLKDYDPYKNVANVAEPKVTKDDFDFLDDGKHYETVKESKQRILESDSLHIALELWDTAHHTAHSLHLSKGELFKGCAAALFGAAVLKYDFEAIWKKLKQTSTEKFNKLLQAAKIIVSSKPEQAQQTIESNLNVNLDGALQECLKLKKQNLLREGNFKVKTFSMKNLNEKYFTIKIIDKFNSQHKVQIKKEKFSKYLSENTMVKDFNSFEKSGMGYTNMVLKSYIQESMKKKLTEEIDKIETRSQDYELWKAAILIKNGNKPPYYTIQEDKNITFAYGAQDKQKELGYWNSTKGEGVIFKNDISESKKKINEDLSHIDSWIEGTESSEGYNIYKQFAKVAKQKPNDIVCQGSTITSFLTLVDGGLGGQEASDYIWNLDEKGQITNSELVKFINIVQSDEGLNGETLKQILKMAEKVMEKYFESGKGYQK